ncbi:MAG: hypothetical protein ACPG1A_16815, partial [Halioglobus sp.]
MAHDAQYQLQAAARRRNRRHHCDDRPALISLRTGTYIIGIAIAVSLALNAWVLWTRDKGGEDAPDIAAATPKKSSVRAASRATPADLASIHEELGKLHDRLDEFEETLTGLAEVSQRNPSTAATQQELTEKLLQLKRSHGSQSSTYDED